MTFSYKRKCVLCFTGCVIFAIVIMVPFKNLTKMYNRKYATSSAQHARDSSSSNDDETTCSLWKFSENRIQSVKPRIQLDPGRFLYPGMAHGPNNQILGLKESVFLAIRLNRTFVIPYFWAHYRNKKSDIPPHQVIDVDRLCRFVSCISIPRFREVCDGAFDVLLEVNQITKSDLNRVEKYTGMDILKIKKKLNPVENATKLKIVDSDLTSSLPVLFHKGKMSASVSALVGAYGTPAPCALYAQAFRTISVSMKNNAVFPLDKFSTEIANVADDVLYSAVTDAVRHPPCIIEAAQAYIREVLQDTKYIAVHWRYNENDWGLSCFRQRSKRATKTSMCRKVFGITPEDIAQGVWAKLSHDKQLSTDGNISFVHMATPPSITYFKEDFYDELIALNKNIRKPEERIDDFLIKKYKSCWDSAGWHAKPELLSLVEMVIMEQSSWFFYSHPSSWSENVLSLRTEQLSNSSTRRKYSNSVYEVALSAKKKRRRKEKLQNIIN